MNNNSKFVFLTILGILIIFISIIFYFKKSAPNKIPANLNKITPANVRCTMDVRQCPDGSYVGRIPPSCSFAPCP